MRKTVILIFFFLALSAGLVKGEIRMPAIFGDNMVLQQQSEANIWGWANPSSGVSVKTSWNGKSYSTRADNQGKWRVKVTTPQASKTPYSITISDGKALSINNVLIGEVWICSGQSNMDMPMSGYSNQPIENSQDAIVRSKNSNIRLFKYARAHNIKPQDDGKGTWTESNPGTVSEFSATAYFFGKLLYDMLDIPVGLISTNWGGSRIEAWINEDALKEVMPLQVPAQNEGIERPQHTHTLLYNAMIHPLIGYGIKGAIWYQGESNLFNASIYPQLFDTMIRSWRKLWQVGEFPVYYAQIAPYDNGGQYNSAFMRESQLKCMKITPNTGMAVLMDADSPKCVHPPKKKEAGERLAYWALAETYGIKGFNYKSPEIKSTEVKNNTIIISFDNARKGLTSYGKPVTQFKIAGKDKRWYDATVTIDQNKVYVFSPRVQEPIAVRYAFQSDSPAELFGNDGLPVSSFRTDDW